MTNTDDPYYCGLRARIPNFVKARTSALGLGVGGKKNKSGGGKHAAEENNNNNGSSGHKGHHGGVGGPVSLPPQIPSHPFWWHSRLYNDMAAAHAAAAASGHMSKLYILLYRTKLVFERIDAYVACRSRQMWYNQRTRTQL